mmetsp:Transcript_32327/g.82387  ORF Transcript_32327/g.82387 Transcript_32327/m.82387 type:complete len:245 (+) Transcript_32327:179-913(+)
MRACQRGPARGAGAPHALPHPGVYCRPVQPGRVGGAVLAAWPRLAHAQGSPESNGWPDIAAPEPLDRLAAATRARRRASPRPDARRAVRRPRDSRAARVRRANGRGAARRGAAAPLPRAAQGYCSHRPSAALLRCGVLAASEPRVAGLPPAARRGEPGRAAGARRARREQLRRPGGPLAPGQLRRAAAAARDGLHQAALPRRAGALHGAAHRLLHGLREPAGRGAPRRVRRAPHAPPRQVQRRA